jgi:hypothetical protein
LRTLHHLLLFLTLLGGVYGPKLRIVSKLRLQVASGGRANDGSDLRYLQAKLAEYIFWHFGA